MKSVYRWISEHTGLCRTALFLVLLAFSFYAATLEYVPFLTVYLVVLVIWFIVGRFIATAPAKLLREPLEQLHQRCDPYPLMEETQRQLTRQFDGPHRQILEMNYAVTLRETGEYRKALEILENINIDKFPGTTPFSKYVYYHNLCDLNYVLGRREEARIWYRKCKQIYRDIPISKVQQELTASYELLEAHIMYYDENHEDALRKVTWIKLPNTYMALSGALLAAKCHIALAEPEKAREKLQYIIDRGNKLHMVQDARDILQALN